MVPLPKDGIAPDRFEIRLRFIFGALIGGFAVGAGLFRTSFSPVVFGVGTATGALARGLPARHVGDRFWRALRWRL